MKRSFINLKHQQCMDLKHPTTKLKSRIRILSQLPPQSTSVVLSYLRLTEIVVLYQSLMFNHRCQDLKRSILNYLILSNRAFTKWEQKQFLDLLSLEMDQKQEQQAEIRKVHSDGKIYIPVNSSVQWRVSSEQAEQNNDRSRINRCKQSIINDVDRTFFKSYHRLQRKRNSQMNSKQNSINNNQIDRRLKSENQPKPEIENGEAYPYYITLPTEPTLATNLLHRTSSRGFETRSQHSAINEESGYSNSGTQFGQQQKMQAFLKNTLLIISQKYPMIGYIQGFNYIAKNMFLTGFEQEQACRYLSYLIEYKNLGNIILNNMCGIRKLSYVLKVYLFNYVPRVYQYFKQSEVQPQVFCTSWFVTLFAQDLSVQIVNKLWHLFVLQGWKIFIQFGVAFICAYQNQILAKEPDQIFTYMRRIMELFNEECKGKIGRGNRIWDRNSKKDEIVWKLMTSVQVSGTIMAQLCRQMANMHNDSEIQIWRIKQTEKRLQNSRKSYTKLFQQSQHGRSEQHNSCSRNPVGSQICCDRLTNTEMVTCTYSVPRSNNIFSLCRNVDSYVE